MIRTCRQSPAFCCLHQQRTITTRQIDDLFETRAAELRVWCALTRKLALTRAYHTFANRCARFVIGLLARAKQRIAGLRHLYHEIDAIQQRPRQTIAVALHLVRRAAAIPEAGAQVAAGAETRCLFAIRTRAT